MFRLSLFLFLLPLCLPAQSTLGEELRNQLTVASDRASAISKVERVLADPVALDEIGEREHILLRLSLARSYSQLDRIGPARLQADFALDLARSARPEWLATVHHLRAQLALRAGDRFEALAACNAGLKRYAPGPPAKLPRPHPTDLSRRQIEEAIPLLGSRASLLAQSNIPLEALVDYELLFELQDRLREDLSPENAWSFLATPVRSYYDEAVNLLINYAAESQDDEFLWDAFLLSDRAKSQALLRTVVLDQNTRDRQELALRERMDELAFDAAGLEAAELQLNRLLYGRRRAAAATHRRAPGRDIVKTLRQEGKTVAAFHLGANGGHVFIASPDGRLQCRKIPDIRALPARVASYKATLAGGPARRELGEAIYTQLFGEMALTDTRLVILPDGPLAQLPFAALPVPGAAGRYLIDDNTVSYGRFSADVKAARPGNGDRFTTDVLVVGERAQSVDPGGIYTVKTLRGAGAAGRERALAEAGRARIFQLHARGAFLADDPAGSCLSFAPGGQSPNLEQSLCYTDIAALDLRPDLVVLPGVAAAHGEDSPPFQAGWAGAFLGAGAGAVLSTVWPGEQDGAAALLKGFYRFLGEGDAADLALARAQRELRRGAAHGQPRFWAGAQLYGSTAGIPPRPPAKGATVSLAGGAAALLLLAAASFLLWRRKQGAAENPERRASVG